MAPRRRTGAQTAKAKRPRQRTVARGHEAIGRETDEAHMARCLALAAQHQGRTAPNPMVGAVIVARDGTVLAEGAHRGPGTDHAEVAALRALDAAWERGKVARRAVGATMYVNLEPCNHFGRTPPCAPAVRDSGVARVVVGMRDPIKSHAGGIALLRRAGIEVETGVLREACERQNRGFVLWATAKRPAFTLKAAITLDGKIATVAGQSKWITGAEARADVMRLRDEHDAVMVGVGTVLADDPALTARRPGARDPIRVVVDSQLRTPRSAQIARPSSTGPRTIIACGVDAPARRERALVAQGVEVWRLQVDASGRVALDALAERLGAAGILRVLVEGGGALHASLLAAQLFDEVVVYVAPIIVGGPAKSWVGGAGIASLDAAYGLAFDREVVALGADLRLTAQRAR